MMHRIVVALSAVVLVDHVWGFNPPAVVPPRAAPKVQPQTAPYRVVAPGTRPFPSPSFLPASATPSSPSFPLYHHGEGIHDVPNPEMEPVATAAQQAEQTGPAPAEEQGKGLSENTQQAMKMEAGTDTWSLFAAGMFGTMVGALSVLGSRVLQRPSAAPPQQQLEALEMGSNSFSMAHEQDSGPVYTASHGRRFQQPLLANYGENSGQSLFSKSDSSWMPHGADCPCPVCQPCGGAEPVYSASPEMREAAQAPIVANFTSFNQGPLMAHDKIKDFLGVRKGKKARTVTNMTIAEKITEVSDAVKDDLKTIGAKFPIDLSKYDKTVKLDPWSNDKLTDEQKKALKENIEVARAAIVFLTATGSASGYGGHTGGPYDTAPEVAILEAVFNGCPDKCVPTLYDEAGHRAGTQYLRSALNGLIPEEQLFFYRKGGGLLPGHPELGMTPGVEFSSGRLGHMWPFVNGVGLANPDKAVICLGSDGSQMEGNDAEAARFAVACNIPVKLFIDDNDVTIAGNPSDYLKGYSVSKTLRGHGLDVIETTEDLDELWAATQKAFQTEGPVAVVIKRQMCEGWEGLAGQCQGHDAASVPLATSYLESRGYKEAVALLDKIPKAGDDYEYLGTGERNATRVAFGVEANKQISKLSDEERKRRIRCIDVDLGGSTGIGQIKAEHPDIYISSGIMERGNYSACAGFGQDDRQAIFATFCAFIEMLMSEITMARLNNSNVLAHFSHSGVDDMADNTCHFGLNPFFANNGLALDEHGHPEDTTKLYWPADVNHMGHVMEEIFWDKGQRFIMSTRSRVPAILKEDGSEFFGKDYKFVKGKDDLIMDGTDGYIVTFGDALYRSIDAATRLKKEGINVGVINKSCLVDVDEEMMAKLAKAPFVLVVESLLETTGLGIRFGTWLLVRGGECNYAHVGVNKLGAGGLHEHAYQQGYDPASIMAKVKEMHAKK